ncbi:MAG: metallophosphoesterase family protein, partial [Candidatus Micrarchaeaceae archaeon]
MPSFSSIILRFRDLSTPAGTTTLAEHRKIIGANGYVWWGWWHKKSETVPVDAFRAIRTSIQGSEPYPLFLFDSGRHHLHRAYLGDIAWDRDLTPIATPDRERTPDYYGDAHYLAWFQLTEIDNELLPEDTLRNWSYVRVDEFFETKKSVFDAFYNKRVASFTELRNQDRTIWFIRPATGTDGVHEIHVYDRSKTAPSNFSEQVVQLHSANLLRLSDPHFSTDHHDFPRKKTASASNLSEAVRLDLEHTGVASIGGLLISGDLTWRGKREEFEWAKEFIGDVKSWAKLTSDQILVCPGNHDLAFSKEPWRKGTKAVETGDAAVAEYRDFYQQLYEVKPTNELACGRRFWIPDGGIVDVVSLNRYPSGGHHGGLRDLASADVVERCRYDGICRMAG